MVHATSKLVFYNNIAKKKKKKKLTINAIPRLAGGVLSVIDVLLVFPCSPIPFTNDCL